MAEYLETTLTEPHIQTICLRDNGTLKGLIALQRLPWMSRHFGMRMYAIRHLLVRSDGPLEHTRLVRFVMEELPEVDFLDCRVAVDDIYSAHALELCGFRYVGTEVFMGRTLDPKITDLSLPDANVHTCSSLERDDVLDIVEQTHIHNRFVYDPLIQKDIATSLYRRLLENCFDTDQFHVMVARSNNEVDGFITSKISESFSNIVGVRSGSLDFIGVRPKSRSRGLGVTLNRAALFHMARRGVRFVSVRTLASNYPALQILYRSGFSVTSSSLHFHKWVHRPKVTATTAQPEATNVFRFATSFAVS
jgi:ribosomal protein S18 acetylase RimI-like enzyme